MQIDVADVMLILKKPIAIGFLAQAPFVKSVCACVSAFIRRRGVPLALPSCVGDVGVDFKPKT